jgi:hypothetical protein
LVEAGHGDVLLEVAAAAPVFTSDHQIWLPDTGGAVDQAVYTRSALIAAGEVESATVGAQRAYEIRSSVAVQKQGLPLNPSPNTVNSWSVAVEILGGNDFNEYQI